MPTNHRKALRDIRTFPSLICYLRDEMDWPIGVDDFEDEDDLFYDFTPEELGIDAKNAAKIQGIKRLRPLSPHQPWGIFFVKFEQKRLPVVALRRILGQVALKKRASANSSERQAWAADDLLFVSNYGEGDQRQISFAHFSAPDEGHDLPTLKVLGWDNRDTALHLDAVAHELTEHLAWPDDEEDPNAWREGWRAAFFLRHRQVITTSRDLSIRLAELASSIRDRIRTALLIETDHGSLTRLMRAFQSSLVHDLDSEGFADMYAQTIAYGLLSARIADPQKKTADDFAGHMRTNPFLRELMETFLKVGGRHGKAGGAGIDFDELGVSEVVQLLDDANMEAVVRDFGDRNPQEDPVIHFYELFLKEYDAKKRMQRGVFYTPRAVVSYIVRSVDELLRAEFGLVDGLADTTTWGEMAKRHADIEIPEGVSTEQDFVQVLDPATGTGTFLVEVIDLVKKTLVAKWKAQGHGDKEIGDLWNDYVPKHLLTRLHGYELLMAPYAIAHLKVGLKLYETGYRFGSDERARVYLTNALEPASSKQLTLDFLPALAHEAEEVNAVKRTRRFTVVIGNPPYSGLSANMGPWIDGLLKGKQPDGTPTASYYHVDREPLGERKLWLQDDYVKFTRLSQWLIETTGNGVHGFISNHGHLDNPTFRGMRWSLMAAFDRIDVLDLHGNLKKKEKHPGGGKDVNVFDIQQGVAIGLFVKRRPNTHDVNKTTVRHTDLWGERLSKYNRLIKCSVSHDEWETVDAAEPFFLFEPFDSSENEEYKHWLAINEVIPVNVTGVVTARDGFVVDISRDALIERIADLRDTSLSDDEIREKYFGGKGAKKYPAGDSRGWKLPDARAKLRDDAAWQERCAPLLYRPFDTRHLYYVPWMVDWPRTEVMPHMLAMENVSLGTTRSVEIGSGFAHIFASRAMIQHHTVSIKEVNYQFPLYLYPNVGKSDASLFGPWPKGLGGRTPNLNPGYVASIEQATGLAFLSDGRGDLTESFGPEDVLAFIYAVLHCPGYRSRFEPMLKLDFPRVPPPASVGVFVSLVRLGSDLTALHLLDSPLLDGARSSYVGLGTSEVGRVGWSAGTVWIDANKTDARKGHRATEPGTMGFQGVPEEVWDFPIGGYQVCHKWLKDRKGRTLSADDIAQYQKIVMALTETIRLMKEIDDVVEHHGGWPGAFQTSETRNTHNQASSFSPRIVVPSPEEKYVTCVPLVPLKAAAGAFGDPQSLPTEKFEWVRIEQKRKLRPGMFVAQVVGKSMEPTVPDGAFCLFMSPVTGSREGRVVLAQLCDSTDPESGERYTVKRYESTKTRDGDTWMHTRINLKPVNREYEAIVLIGDGTESVKVMAELVEVLK